MVGSSVSTDKSSAATVGEMVGPLLGSVVGASVGSQQQHSTFSWLQQRGNREVVSVYAEAWALYPANTSLST